jgi:hypothetical protein
MTTSPTTLYTLQEFSQLQRLEYFRGNAKLPSIKPPNRTTSVPSRTVSVN